jgi:hypothetical protein
LFSLFRLARTPPPSRSALRWILAALEVNGGPARG